MTFLPAELRSLIIDIGPIIFVLAAGYFANWRRILPPATGSILSKYLFFFGIPFLVFANITESEMMHAANFRFLLGYFLTLLISASTAAWIFRAVFKLQGPELIIQIVGSFYSNTTYIGVPISVILLNSAIPPLMSLLIQVLFFLPAATALLDVMTLKEKTIRASSIIRTLVTNPILVAGIAAILVSTLHIRIPIFFRHSVQLMGAPPMTLGLFALGFTCYFPDRRGFTRQQVIHALIGALIKIFYQPAIAFLLASFVLKMDAAGIRDLTVCAALPSAVNGFVLSQRYESGENEAKLTLLFSTGGFMALVILISLLNRTNSFLFG